MATNNFASNVNMGGNLVATQAWVAANYTAPGSANLVPTSDNTYTFGSGTARWSTAFIEGALYGPSLVQPYLLRTKFAANAPMNNYPNGGNGADSYAMKLFSTIPEDYNVGVAGTSGSPAGFVQNDSRVSIASDGQKIVLPQNYFVNYSITITFSTGVGSDSLVFAQYTNGSGGVGGWDGSFTNLQSTSTSSGTVTWSGTITTTTTSYAVIAAQLSNPASGPFSSCQVQSLVFTDTNGSVMPLSGTGTILPAVDNTYNIGNGSLRFGTIYAATGTINTSARHLKKRLRRMAPHTALELVRALRPTRFVLADDPLQKIHLGVLADETEQALRRVGVPQPRHYGLLDYANDHDNNAPTGLRYSELIAPLIGAVQALDQELREMKRSRCYEPYK